MRTHGLGLILGAVSGTALSISSAHAGGFMLQEQSQVEIGRAFSGAAAAADDPSAIFYNPAAMTELPHMQISTGATALFIQSRQRDLGTTRTGPGATPTQAVGGGNGGNPFAPVVPLPTSFASKQCNAFGATTPTLNHTSNNTEPCGNAADFNNATFVLPKD